MENTRAMSIQLPEETYQRMKSYLKRDDMKQKDFMTSLLQRALDNDSTSTPGGA